METKHFHPRKLARQMARAQFDKSKIHGYNKERTGMNGSRIPSLFARKWREIAEQKARKA